MKIVIESSDKLTDCDLEEIVDGLNRKGRRIAVKTHIQTLILSHMHTLTTHAPCQALSTSIMNFNNTISKGGGRFQGGQLPYSPLPLPLNKTLIFVILILCIINTFNHIW